MQAEKGAEEPPVGHVPNAFGRAFRSALPYGKNLVVSFSSSIYSTLTNRAFSDIGRMFLRCGPGLERHSHDSSVHRRGRHLDGALHYLLWYPHIHMQDVL